MPVLEAVCWAVIGAALMEASNLYMAIHAARGFPWKRRGQLELKPYLAALGIRLGMAAALTAVFAASGQVVTVTSACAVGVATPKILEQIARRVPQDLPVSQHALDAGPRMSGASDPARKLTSQPHPEAEQRPFADDEALSDEEASEGGGTSAS